LERAVALEPLGGAEKRKEEGGEEETNKRETKSRLGQRGAEEGIEEEGA
jgi:hypothetical protein